MTRPIHLGTLVLILFSASVVLGAPAAGQTAVPPAAPPAAAPAAPPSAVPNDGYGRTLRFFQTILSKAAEIEAVLRTVHSESAAASSGDKAKQSALFLKKLKEKYPEATFDGTVGTVTFQKPFVAHFTNALKVDRIVEEGKVTLQYLVSQGRIQLSNDKNSVTVLLDLNEPARSSFINATIPEIKPEAEKIVIDPDRKRIAADSVETAVLNDAYQLLSLTSNERMDVFAAGIIRNPKAQEQALKVAANGYRDRHPQEYQAADPNQKKKKVDTRPNRPADQRFYQGFIRMSALLLLAAAVVWAVARVIRALKLLSSTPTNAQRMRKNQYYSLSPMVKRALNRSGRLLWGINLPWARKYYIYERKNRWLLCDGIEDKEKRISQANTRIEVHLRSTYFKLQISRLNGAEANIWLHCHDFSRRDLLRGLQEIRQELKDPTGRDDGIDGEETATTGQPASSPPPPAEPASTAPAPEPAPGEAARPDGETAVPSDQPKKKKKKQKQKPAQQRSDQGETAEAGPEPAGHDAPVIPESPAPQPAGRTDEGQAPAPPEPSPETLREPSPPAGGAAAPLQPEPAAEPEMAAPAVTGNDMDEAAAPQASRKRPPRWSANPRLRR